MAKIVYSPTRFEISLENIANLPLQLPTSVSASEIVLYGTDQDFLKLTLTAADKFTFTKGGAPKGGDVGQITLEYGSSFDEQGHRIFQPVQRISNLSDVGLKALYADLKSGDVAKLLTEIFGGKDTATGSAGDDFIATFGGADKIAAGRGNDMIREDPSIYFDDKGAITGVSAGNDVIDGGGSQFHGFESASFTAFGDILNFGHQLPRTTVGITVDVEKGVATDIFGDRITFKNIEGVYGTNGDDVLKGSNDGAPEIFFGNYGHDAIDGRGGSQDTISYAYSGADLGATVNLALGTGKTVGHNPSNPSKTVQYSTDSISNVENVIGSAYADKITGDGHANTIAGDLGSDTLKGGGGDDHFAFFNYNVSVVGSDDPNLDEIKDFKRGHDVLDFSHTGFGFATAGAAFDLIVKAGAEAKHDFTPTFLFDAKTHVLSFDPDGSSGGEAVELAVLNVGKLGLGDIHLI